MKTYLAISFIAVSLITTVSADACSKCVKVAQCASYGILSKQEQEAWQIAHPCASPSAKEYGKLFGYSNIAKGDYVCCDDPNVKPTVGNRNLDYNNYGNPNNYDDPNTGYNYPNQQNPNGYDFGNGRQNNNGWGSDNGNGNAIGYPNQGDDGGYGYTQSPPRNYFNNPYVTSSPFFPAHGLAHRGDGNQGQCPVTSFPPKPETGCCGREAADSDRIIGGRETELEQFPWTVLLEITFDYGDRRQAFNCGGSLISSKYILTAGHCVFDQGGKIVNIDIYLAEYDKRTFPKDCKNVLGEGQKCVENIVMKAEDVVLHPQYDDTHLNNDIALIRIQGLAPYTDYIRPICLPTIDIDSPDFFNLRLAVAGWGRNGRYRSDIKQSTIVNLVPQAKCKKFYPSLSRRQMCAAGYSGEDTCKGDSGGPLMTLYGGKYEVVGVVSGKRADSPCGTSVPSLYTNVYHYGDWIRSNMKN
ncbi:hypothetical protein PYW07_017106 [Mythimna separata]|uniref:Peptidase S1 domain-containing protein n=1 Tax=Mythimna separata TaxID=271217 RepID=A0AAD8DXE1_MYTSE|nr:hypothetical protein PYW07_017106 [Mythimna separata]